MLYYFVFSVAASFEASSLALGRCSTRPKMVAALLHLKRIVIIVLLM